MTIALNRSQTGLKADCVSGTDNSQKGGFTGTTERNEPTPVRSSAREVAQLVAGSQCIGLACDALKRAGLVATIAGNRISVDGRFSVQYIGACIDAEGEVLTTWAVSGLSLEAPILTSATGSDS